MHKQQQSWIFYKLIVHIIYIYFQIILLFFGIVHNTWTVIRTVFQPIPVKKKSPLKNFSIEF